MNQLFLVRDAEGATSILTQIDPDLEEPARPNVRRGNPK